MHNFKGAYIHMHKIQVESSSRIVIENVQLFLSLILPTQYHPISMAISSQKKPEKKNDKLYNDCLFLFLCGNAHVTHPRTYTHTVAQQIVLYILCIYYNKRIKTT